MQSDMLINTVVHSDVCVLNAGETSVILNQNLEGFDCAGLGLFNYNHDQ